MKLVHQSHRPGGALIGVPNQAPRPRSGSESATQLEKSAPPLEELDDSPTEKYESSSASEEHAAEVKPLDTHEGFEDSQKAESINASQEITEPEVAPKIIKSKKVTARKKSSAPKISSENTPEPEKKISSVSAAAASPPETNTEKPKSTQPDSRTAGQSNPNASDQEALEESSRIQTKTAPADPRSISKEGVARREGDSAAIKPPENPRRMRPLTQEDEVKLKKAETQAEEVEEPITAPWLFRGLHWLFGPALSSFFLLGVCVFGLFVYSQVLSILSQLATLPTWAQWIGTGALGILGAMGGWVMLRFLSMYLKLRSNKQFSLKSLTDRSEMRRLRWKHVQKCKRHLSEYLAEHNFEDVTKRQELMTAGLSAEQIQNLSFAKKSLLDQELRIESQGWVKRFYEEFQKRLDEAADQEIRRHATRVGVKTAVVPIPLIDAIVTIYHSFSLFRSLCGIYQVRLNGLGTLYLMGLAFFSAYLTGKLEEGAEDLTDAITENSSTVLAGFSRVVTPKLAEGFGAALLVNRLGKEAKKRLQPLSPK